MVGVESTLDEAEPHIPVSVIGVGVHKHHALPGTECGPAVKHWQRERR